MKIKNVKKIDPQPAKCIEIDGEDRLFAAGGEKGDGIISHNSVVQRNIICACIMRPSRWRFLGIDLKKVELSAFRKYSNVVLGIATELEDALTVLRFGQQTMMKRYQEMEELGVNNFLDLPSPGQALLIMIDEAGELLSPSGVKSLSEKTLIPLPDGSFTTMGNLRVGDTILNSFSLPTKVVRKYEPEGQTRFSMTISSDKTGQKEDFIAGSEHDWMVFVTNPDGTVSGPEKWSTQEIFDFKKSVSHLPVEDRPKIRFRRYIPCDSSH